MKTTKLKRLYILATVFFLAAVTNAQVLENPSNKKLNQYTQELIEGFDRISEERKLTIEEVAEFILTQKITNDETSALFVCTHNSRRSHIADLWFRYGLWYYGLSGFGSYSGGTEATAFNVRAIDAIERAGFNVSFDKKVENPVVSISPAQFPVWNMKSKKYSDPVNPKSNFTAVMVCSDADKSCPYVEGASGRFAITYDDPRHYDNTPSEKKMYDETLELIGTEILYLVSIIKSKNIALEEQKSSLK